MHSTGAESDIRVSVDKTATEVPKPQAGTTEKRRRTEPGSVLRRTVCFQAASRWGHRDVAFSGVTSL